MAGCSKSIDDKLEHYRISGSGIRGHNYHDDKWVIKKNAILVVKCDDNKCLCTYTISRSTESDKEIYTDVGRIYTDLQKVLRRFLNSDEDSEIKMKVTSTIVDESKGILPAYIELYGRKINKVTNAITAIKEKIKEINKKPEYQGKAKLAIRKIPLKDKNKANDQTDEGATSLQDTENEEMGNPVHDEGDTNVSLNEEDNTEVKTLVNDAGDSAGNSLKRKQSDAEMLTDEPVCKQMKRITSTSSLQNMLEDCGIIDQKGAECTAENEDEKKTFNFRLLYLLVEIGVSVLRNIFDKQVNGDFEKHLKDNHQHQSRLDFLIRKNILNETQQELIQPKNGKPSSCNFDITLLALLLRNVCGFRDSKDPVWTNPDSSDETVEADICRLRLIRNEVLGHITTVYISENEFTKLWKEIKMVLIKLDSQYGNGDIESKIDAAEIMPTDERYEKMKAEYEEYVRKWQEMDDIIEEGGEMIIEAVTVAVNRLKENYYQQKSK